VLATPEQLDALAQAGVVDSGACGLVLVLDALRVAAEGLEDPAAVSLEVKTSVPVSHPVTAAAITSHTGSKTIGVEDGFEVMFTLTRPAGATDFATGEISTQLRKELGEIGNSVVVVGGSAVSDPTIEAMWHAHVHLDRLAGVIKLIEKWRTLGVVGDIQVRHLAVPATPVEVWVVASAPGLIGELARAGAVVLLIPQADEVIPEVIQAVSNSPAGAHIILVAPQLVPAVDGAIHQADVLGNGVRALVLGTPNEAATVLVLLAIAEGGTPEQVLAAALETANELLVGTTKVGSDTLPKTWPKPETIELAVAVVPESKGKSEAGLDQARVQIESSHGELVALATHAKGEVIKWAALQDE
jgi:hypothetical protein